MPRKEKPKKNRYEYLTQTPVEPLICTLAVPTIISMLVTGIYNAADTFFVGRISTQATAAVGLVFSVMAIIQALGFFCGHGSGNYLSRQLGAGNEKEAKEMAVTGFTLALLLGVVVALLGNVFAKELAHLLGATPTTMEDTCRYMRIILLGAPFMMAQFVINNQLRFQGSAIYAMAGLMVGASANMVLDPVLIFGFHLGVAGAAIATVSGQILSFFTLFFMSRKGENIRLEAKNIRFTPHYLLAIVNGGSPSLLRQGMAAIATMMLNTYAGQLGGDAAIAAMSIVNRALMLLTSIVIGFGQGYQPVCSFCYGAKLTDRVKKGYYFCLRYSTIFLILAGIGTYVFAPQVISFFRDDPEVVAVGTQALRIQSVFTLPLMGIIMISNMMLQSIGKGLKASITSSARNGIFFLPMILILPRVFGLLGVEMAQSWADVLTVILTVPMAISEIRKM